ncbi:MULTISPECIES: extracellular catalytic domain type 1 short-chain-length polyhydroxyalkanoate depolymerase [unclassified Lysobacter]
MNFARKLLARFKGNARAAFVAGHAAQASRAGSVEPAAARASVTPGLAGTFTSHSFTSDAGTLDYKLYIPSGHLGANGPPAPLVVMLHGCSQSPDDFAAGTQMNRLADVHGFLVAYPEQSAAANMNRCWNWFQPEHQKYGRGEPSLIVGITEQVASDHHVDPERIFVAGLSAGGAMAVILGECYPDIFAAVGVHSGLAFGAADGLMSALSAMKSGASGSRSGSAVQRDAHRPVPTIVFQGDADHTVAPSNADLIVRDATASAIEPLTATTEKALIPTGRSYTREVFSDPAGHPQVEYWRIHDADHAWSGGSPQGSYTDPAGPDASAEMVRFFLQQG